MLQCGHFIGPHLSTLLSKFMHERKCDLCNTTVYGFSDRAAAELLEEHMEDRHSLSKPAKSSEDLQLTTADEDFLTSMRIGW